MNNTQYWNDSTAGDNSYMWPSEESKFTTINSQDWRMDRIIEMIDKMLTSLEYCIDIKKFGDIRNDLAAIKQCYNYWPSCDEVKDSGDILKRGSVTKLKSRWSLELEKDIKLEELKSRWSLELEKEDIKLEELKSRWSLELEKDIEKDIKLEEDLFEL